MNLLRPFAYLLGTTLLRALNGLVVLKILALNTNLAEFGRLSQVAGFIGLFGMFAAGGIGSGLTRQLASEKSETDQQRWLLAALKIYLIVSMVLAVVLLSASWTLTRWLLEDSRYIAVFICMAAGQAIVGAATLAQAIAAARENYLFTLQITAVGALVGVSAVGFGVGVAGAFGGAIALVVNAALPGIVALAIKRTAVRRLVARVGEKIKMGDAATLMKYASVSLLGAASLSVSQIASRDLVGKSLGWETVGLWQTVTRISDVYMQLVSVALMSYVLPQLARTTGFETMHPLFLRFGSAICGVFICAAAMLFLLRDYVITLLFSTTFLAAGDLLPLQLVGDLFRIVAVSISVALMARGLTKTSMFYEFAQGCLVFVLTALLLEHTFIAAPLQAYCLTYAVLMLVMTYIYCSHLSQTRQV